MSALPCHRWATSSVVRPPVLRSPASTLSTQTDSAAPPAQVNTLRLNTLTRKDQFQSQSCEVVLTRICYTLWWFAHKGRVVSQAPQHFRFFFKWKILVMVALACQFVCSVISLDSGMSRALHLQKPLKVKVKGPKALCEATSPYFKN